MRTALLLALALLVGEVAPAQQPGGGNSQNLAALEAEAERLYAEDDLDGAIALYKELAQRHTETSERARMLIAAAWLEYYSGLWETAKETMLAALSLAPDYPFESSYYSQEFVDLYQRSLAQVRIERSRRARERTAAAVAAIAERRLDAARPLLQEALTLEPDYPPALYNLALVDLESGHRQEAMDGFQRVLSIARSADADRAVDLGPALKAQTLANLGLLHLQQGYLEDAEEAFRESLSLVPDDATAWTNLGLTYRRLGRHDEALDAFGRAYELDPSDAAVINNLALGHLDAQNWQSAAELLQEGVSKHPEDASLWLNLGMAQRGLEHLDDAVASFRRAIELDTGNASGTAATASTHLAVTLLQAGDHAGAMEAARRALELDPESVEGWNYLGLAQQSAGDVASAQQSLRHALDLDPARADTANNLGNAYFAAGDYDAAAQSFRTALELRPDFATARTNLELAEARLRREAAHEEEGATSASSAKRPPGTAEPAATGSRPAARSPDSAPGKTARGRKGTRGTPAADDPLGLVLVDDRHDVSGLRAARVTKVETGGVAERAGLREGDLVVRADSIPIESAAALDSLLRSLANGKHVALDLVRDGAILRLSFPPAPPRQ